MINRVQSVNNNCRNQRQQAFGSTLNATFDHAYDGMIALAQKHGPKELEAFTAKMKAQFPELPLKDAFKRVLQAMDVKNADGSVRPAEIQVTQGEIDDWTAPADTICVGVESWCERDNVVSSIEKFDGNLLEKVIQAAQNHINDHITWLKGKPENKVTYAKF